jgi:N-acetylneuraminic acid mutarotase
MKMRWNSSWCSMGALVVLFSAAVLAGQPQPASSSVTPPVCPPAGGPRVVESVPASWVLGAPFPAPFPASTVVRAAGVWHPGFQRFYVMGGRAFDGGGGELTTPYEYNPSANVWWPKTALWPDTFTNNMAAAVLTGFAFGFHGQFIYTVGGSSSSVLGCTADVRVYDPGLDILAPLVSDPWPGNPGFDTLPGGWAVYNNKLYIFGGFSSILGTVFGDIWRFDPLAADGARWTKMTATLPVPLGYIPATTIGPYIYLAGGSEYPGVLTNTTYSYRYDPVADTITTIPSIPRVTSNTQAVNQGGQMWVLGGAWPDASNEVDACDPGLASWSLGLPMTMPTRNFATAIDPATGKIFAVGGYLPGSVVDGTLEIYTPCTSPPPAPTITPGGATTFCSGGSVTLTSSAASGNQWIKDGFDIPAATGTTYAATASGNYAVRATDSNGCSSTSWVTTVIVRTTGSGAWNAGASFPTPVIRGSGVWFPPNGRFYVLGGRSADGSGNELHTPFEYDPSANTWTALPGDVGYFVNNMAAGFLMGPNGPAIYLVGGSPGGSTAATALVREYNPIGGTLSVLGGDAWPGNPTNDVLPGGCAVWQNKLYIFGGFKVNSNMITDIWQFDPMAAPGARWTKMAATLPVALGYIPATTAGSFIFLAGGSEYVAGVPTDTTYTYRYNPFLDVITPVASIPRATSNTKAVTQGLKVWVLGGTFSGASNEVDVYDPLADTWSVGPALTDVRRNFPVDVDPATGRIFVVGGYDPSTPTNTMEIYSPELTPITLTPPPLPMAVKGKPYTTTLTASPAGVYTFALTGGTLPPGLTLNPATGVLSGAPTTNGIYNFTVTATGASGCTGSQAYAMDVFSQFFSDDLGRSKMCVDVLTGAYTWRIVAGPGAGVYAGTATVLNGGAKIISKPASADKMNVTYDPVRRKASGYFITAAGIYNALSDANTANNVGTCP